jgi:hypothetical protein
MNYPKLSLLKALELPKAILAYGNGEPVREMYAFDKLERSAKSGSGKTLMAAARTAYGLISVKNDYLEITERGKNLIEPKNQLEKYNAAYDALFSSDLFSSFANYFSSKTFPPDKMAADYFVRVHSASEQDAEACWKVFKDNLNDFGLIKPLKSGSQAILSREMAIEEIKIKYPNDSSIRDEAEPEKISEEKTIPLPNPQPDSIVDKATLPLQPMKFPSQPEFHFNIQIHLPSDASADTYDTIFRSIGKYLLGHQEDKK